MDLGFFRVIQSFNDAVPKNEEKLIQVVSAAYKSYLQNKINHTWLTLQCCFNQIIQNNGDNEYNIDHISKEKLECIRLLPDVIDVVEDVAQLFMTNENTNDKTDDKKNRMNKHKRIHILPTQKWGDGGYSQ